MAIKAMRGSDMASIPEAARRLGVTKGTAYIWARTGRFPCAIVEVELPSGRKMYRIPRHALEELLAGR